MSGCRLLGRQLSLILPKVVYELERETPSDLVTPERDGRHTQSLVQGVRGGVRRSAFKRFPLCYHSLTSERIDCPIRHSPAIKPARSLELPRGELN